MNPIYGCRLPKGKGPSTFRIPLERRGGRVKVLMKGSHVGQVDSRFRGNGVYPVRTLTIVIPAKAGIHGCQVRSLAPRL